MTTIHEEPIFMSKQKSNPKKAKKEPDPVVVVVEDDPNWRLALGLMYSRILRGVSKKADETMHPSVKMFATAQEAISYFKAKCDGRSKNRSKVDILSLDMNLGKGLGGTGFSVLKEAAGAGQAFATIIISKFASDTDLHEQLGKKTKLLVGLETNVTNITKARCEVEPKYDEALGSIADQVKAIETKLRAKVHGNSNVLRTWRKELRNTAADLNGKSLCLHFVIPKLSFQPCSVAWVPGSNTQKTRKYLDTIGVWQHDFVAMDSSASSLLTRLLYLVTNCENKYLSGLSLTSEMDLVNRETGDTVDPLPADKWICPGEGTVSNPTAREVFMLLQLEFQRRLGVGERPKKTQGESVETAKARSSSHYPGLEVSGVLTTKPLLRPDGSAMKNGDSLDVDRDSGDEDRDNTVKQAKFQLNKSLKEILKVDYDLISAIDEPFKTYRLEIPVFVYIQCGDD
jgi:hypothetical protein